MLSTTALAALASVATALISLVGVFVTRAFRPVEDRRKEDRYQTEKEVAEWKRAAKDRVARRSRLIINNSPPTPKPKKDVH